VKRLCADDSAATSVKVGYRQANYYAEPVQLSLDGLFAFYLSIYPLTNMLFRWRR
jgi:hypothetical protein